MCSYFPSLKIFYFFLFSIQSNPVCLSGFFYYACHFQLPCIFPLSSFLFLLSFLIIFFHLISKYPLFSSSFFFWNHSYFSFFLRPLRFFILVHHRYFYCHLSLLPSIWSLTPALAFAFFLPLILLCSDSLTFLNSPSFSSCLLPKYTHSSFPFCSVVEWHVQGLFWDREWLILYFKMHN